MPWKTQPAIKFLCLAALLLLPTSLLSTQDETKPVKVFLLAGDANCLEQGVISGRTEGKDAIFFPNEVPIKDEAGWHVNCAVYKGPYQPGVDYDKLTPVATGLVGLGENQAAKKKPRPFAAFPEMAMQDGHTTVLRGFLSVPRSGQYEVHADGADSAFNVTTVDGKEVWRREVGQATATITPVALEKGKRYAFKSIFFKNPGNAEDTWNGVEQIDRWLDFKTYLQSGQEYLELVNAVNDSLAQLPRFLPGYQKQGYEIAGMVWIHGISDSQSPAHKAAYEKNLANLIRNLRRDIKVPKMPVVVTAVAFDDGKIHDAQMAVGDPAKYPEFAGNVKSVDTKPFLRAPNLSPGGYATVYHSNAESFLEIGDAMGKAMLELINAPAKK